METFDMNWNYCFNYYLAIAEVFSVVSHNKYIPTGVNIKQLRLILRMMLYFAVVFLI